MFLTSSKRDWSACGIAPCLLLLLTSTLVLGQMQAGSILCNAGDGKFDAEFRTGIALHAGAAKDGRLATRSCAAKFTWEKQELVAATGVSQLDVDVFGADLGDGIPVAALQIRKSDADCCMEYQIYSLAKPLHLLRTITGGEFYSASDVDLDGRVEIWTNDAAAVNGFENFAFREWDSPPTVVLRFTHGHLQDVSAEFQSYFDDQIVKLQASLPSAGLEDFKASDGKLVAAASISSERLHSLRMTKIKVLEMVWAYPFSGRDTDAWRSLKEMWPPTDVDRIRAAIKAARTRGIHGQADGSSADPAQVRKKRTQIYDVTNMPGPSRTSEVMSPKAILLRPSAPSTEHKAQPDSEVFLNLLVDAAGKIQLAAPVGKVQPVDPDLIRSAVAWKFIPRIQG